MEPLAFAVLSAYTPSHIERQLFDERIEPVPLDIDTDLVAISVETFTARRAYQIAAAYRRRGVPVVMGGYHPTLLPDEVSNYCDALCIGDAEGVWADILADIEAGNLRSRYQQSKPHSLAEGPQLDRGIFTGKPYGMVFPVQFGRGCRYNCDFCSVRAFYGSTVRYRPIESVLAELPDPQNPGRKRLLAIVDDNLFTGPEQAADLCEALRPLGWKWACQTSIEVAHDSELVGLMAGSGCVAVMIGFESLAHGNLKEMNKRWNLRGGDYESAIRKLQRHKIMLYGSFVFGYDHDTLRVFSQTVEFAIRNRLALANFNLLTPTPGTALMERLRKDGRLRYPTWWLDPDYRYGEPAFEPAQMSAEQLRDGCQWARKRFYSVASAIRRASGTPHLLSQPLRLSVFAAANWIAGCEVRTKQMACFGEPDMQID